MTYDCEKAIGTGPLSIENLVPALLYRVGELLDLECCQVGPGQMCDAKHEISIFERK